MLLLSFFIVALISYLIGYYWRDVHERLSGLNLLIANLRQSQNPTPDRPTGTVIEPGEDDPVAQARREFDETQRRLNK